MQELFITLSVVLAAAAVWLAWQITALLVQAVREIRASRVTFKTPPSNSISSDVRERSLRSLRNIQNGTIKCDFLRNKAEPHNSEDSVEQYFSLLSNGIPLWDRLKEVPYHEEY